jgi:hypothetical protein
VADDSGEAGAVLAAVVVGLIYAVGPALPPVQRSSGAAAAWLTVPGAAWLVLLAWTPDGIWLAFPLFSVQLHLLPMRWGLTAVAVTTVAAIGASPGSRTIFPRRWSSARRWALPSPPCSGTRRCTGRAGRAGG